MKNGLLPRIRSAVVLGVALALTVTSAACSSGGPAAGRPNGIVIGVSGDAMSLDPGADTSEQAGAYGSMLFDRLLVRDDRGEFSPGVATEWTQVDDTTWQFTLRKGVKFHDGTELTAADVTFSVNRLITDENLQNSVNIAPYFSQATAVDDDTVEIRSKAPLGTFLNRIAQVYILPQHVVEERGSEEFGRQPVGSGPFTFVSWSTDSEFTASAFAEYWAGPAKIATITYRVIPEDSSRMAALLSGDIDVALGLTPQVSDRLRRDESVDVLEAPSNRVLMFGIQTKNGGPLADARVRKAINHAIDKKALMELMGGTARLMDGKSLMFGPSVTGYSTDIQDYPYDPDRARELLSEAGYGDGVTIEIDAPRNQWPNDVALVEGMATMLEKVGIRATLNILDWTSYRSKALQGTAQGLWMYAMGNPLGDASYYYDIVLSSAGRGYYATERTDQLIAEQARIVDPAERRKALVNLAKLFVEDEAAWIYLWNMVDLNAKSKAVTDLRISVDGEIDYRALTKSSE